MDSSTGYSKELIRSIRTTLGLAEDFSFNGANDDVKKALMDAYLVKLQPSQSVDTASTSVGQGIYYFIIFLCFVS